MGKPTKITRKVKSRSRPRARRDVRDEPFDGQPSKIHPVVLIVVVLIVLARGGLQRPATRCSKLREIWWAFCISSPRTFDVRPSLGLHWRRAGLS
jgi:hypothetical protein